MSDMMTFPDTWEDFEKLYGFNDAEEIYTNNSRLIPSFRVKQWLDQLPSVQPRMGKWETFLEDIDGLHWEVVRCSMCGATKPRKILKSDDFEPNFCPNCGADMRGEQEKSKEDFIALCRGDSDDN